MEYSPLPLAAATSSSSCATETPPFPGPGHKHLSFCEGSGTQSFYGLEDPPALKPTRDLRFPFGSLQLERQRKKGAPPNRVWQEVEPPSHQGPAAHLLIDSLAEDGQEEDGGNGRSQVTGDGLDVVKELPALCRLDHGHPGDADANQAQDEQPGRRRRRQREALGDANPVNEPQSCPRTTLAERSKSCLSTFVSGAAAIFTFIHSARLQRCALCVSMFLFLFSAFSFYEYRVFLFCFFFVFS